MGKRDKSKRSKHQQASANKQGVGDEKLSNKPDHVHVSGKIETDLPPKLVERYDAANNQQGSRERKKFYLELGTAFLIFAYTTGVDPDFETTS